MPVSLPPPLQPATIECVSTVAEQYHLDPDMIVSIGWHESHWKADIGRVCSNKDGSCDIGVMQVNTYWLPRLHKRGITATLLENNECMNIAVGAWVYASNLYQYGNKKAALSAYNTGKPDSAVGLQYADTVLSIYHQKKVSL